MTPFGTAAAARQADPVLTRVVDQDEIPWYRKKNLRRLYALLLPTCIGIEMTSGFDSQMINTVQIAPTWKLCVFSTILNVHRLTVADFNYPEGALLGIISAAYNLGAICALPLVPYVNDHFGRRWSIFMGSWIMVVGSLVQALSVNGTLKSAGSRHLADTPSWHVRGCATDSRLRHSVLHHRRLIAHGRARVSERTTYYDIPFQRLVVRRLISSRWDLIRHSESRG